MASGLFPGTIEIHARPTLFSLHQRLARGHEGGVIAAMALRQQAERLVERAVRRYAGAEVVFSGAAGDYGAGLWRVSRGVGELVDLRQVARVSGCRIAGRTSSARERGQGPSSQLAPLGRRLEYTDEGPAFGSTAILLLHRFFRSS